MKNFTALLFLIVFMFSVNVNSQSTTVENIRKYPRSYHGDNVTVKGLVTIYRAGSGNTKYYILRDDYGATIKVNTAEGPPEINQMYTIEGIVYFDEATNTPFISEKSRTKQFIDDDKEDGKKDTTEIKPPLTTDNTLIYILIGGIAVLVALYFILKGRQSAPAYTPPASSDSYSAPTIKLRPEDMQTQSSDDFKTIKITASSPKTLKFIPGKLTIVSGEDTGKSFKIAGYPTSEGSIVSIGREEVKGDRAYSHIQLMQKTISRKQAEIVQKEGKLYVKNMSDTNYTQLDGVELKVGEKAELKTGAVLRLGELEVKYEA